MVAHSVNLNAKEHLTKGLGSTRSKGKRGISWGMELLRKTDISSKAKASEDRTVIRSFPDTARSVHKGFLEGMIMSHEIENPTKGLYMLLSLHAQGTLGFVKDVASGTVYLKHQDADVQLYAVEGSGLRAVLHRRRRRTDGKASSTFKDTSRTCRHDWLRRR